MTAVSVDSWVLGLRRRERWQRAVRLAAPWLLALAVVFGCGVLLTRPGADAAPSVGTQPLLFALLVIGAAVVLVAAWPRRTPWRRLDVALGLDGMLETYVDASPSDEGPMRAWLERDLAASISNSSASGGGARGLVGVPVRPLRSLLVLLALLYLLGLLLPPLPDGVLPMGAGAGGGAGGGGAGDGTSQARTAAEVPPPSAKEEIPPVPPLPEDEPPPTTLPPEALIAAPETRDAVVVPSFVGQGDGTVTKTAVVDVESAPPAGGGAAPRPTKVASGADGGGEPEVSSPEDPEFRRAAEQAMRSRHVPAGERAFVERWFHVGTGGDR